MARPKKKVVFVLQDETPEIVKEEVKEIVKEQPKISISAPDGVVLSEGTTLKIQQTGAKYRVNEKLEWVKISG